MSWDPRCTPTREALDDLATLRRLSSPKDASVLHTGLALLHRIEGLWLPDVPRIAYLIGHAKTTLVYAAIRGELPGPAVSRALSFLQRHLYDLPIEELTLLGIADMRPKSVPEKTAAGLDKRVPSKPVRTPGEARVSPEARQSALPLTADRVETLERVIQGLRNL